MQARVLGPPDGRCWYVLHASRHKAAPVQLLEPACLAAPRDGDDIFEMAMEGLSEEVCSQFFKISHPGAVSDKAARRLRYGQNRIRELIPAGRDPYFKAWMRLTC